MTRPVDFSCSGAAAESLAPAPGRVLRGDPQQLVWTHYTDSTGAFSAGTWQGEAGAWRVRYAPHEQEFCVLLEGRVILCGDDGSLHECHAGDAFVIPGGFTGVWENHGRVRKHFATVLLAAPCS